MKGIIFILLSVVVLNLQAQFSATSLYTDDDLLEARLHVAKVLPQGLHFIGPSLYQSNFSNGISYENIISNNQTNSTINVAALLTSNKDNNKLLFTTDLQFGGIRYADSNWQLGIDYTLRLYAAASLPSALIELIGRGNAPFIGQRIDIAPQFRASTYHQITLSFAKDLGKFSYGLKANILAGVDDLHSYGGKIGLLTEESFFQLNFDNDFVINSSATLDYVSISDYVVDFDYLNFGSFFNSKGASLDLGLQYKFSDRRDVFLDIKDLGFIKWNRQVSNYTSKQQYSYEGIDIIDFIENTSDIDVVDSLSTILMVDETKQSYRYAMPLNLTLCYRQALDDKLSWSIAAQYHKWKSLSIAVIGIGVDYRWKDFLGVTAGYSYMSQNPYNFGLGISGQWHGVSYFVNTDNILGLWSSRIAQIHLGGAFSL